MPLDKTSAISAYNNIANLIGNTSKVEDSNSSSGDSGFIDMVGKFLNNSVNEIKGGEKAVISSIKNEITTEDLVSAINDAELSLRTMVAIRDRIISVYNEIIRMPI